MIQQLHMSPQGPQSLQRILVPQSLRLLLLHQHEIMFEHFASFLHAVSLGGGRVCGDEIDDEGLLDAEDRVGCFVGGVADV